MKRPAAALSSLVLLFPALLSAARQADNWSDPATQALKEMPRFQRAVVRETPSPLGDGFQLSPGAVLLLQSAAASGARFQRVNNGSRHEANILEQFQEALRALEQKVSPTVVLIALQSKPGSKTSKSPGSAPFSLDEFRKKFFGEPQPPSQPQLKKPPLPGAPIPKETPKPPSGVGSGVIVENTDGKPLIVTNAHVVAAAGVGGEVAIFIKDDKAGKGRKAVVLGYNSKYDLALVKMEDACPACQAAELGDKDNVKASDLVLAVGAPFGLSQTKTLGIVSYAGRATDPQSLVEDFIQTDAVLNPGNSGGPLFNIYGRVIGINAMIFSPMGASVGIGFAIPVRHVMDLIRRYRQTGAIAASRMGASIAQTDRGIEITGAEKGSPAEKAGLQAGDLVVKIDDDDAPKTAGAFVAVIANKVPEQEVTLTLRRAGQELKIKIKLAAVTASPDDE